MNKFEINALGLEEMGANEQVKTDGGHPLVIAAIAVVVIVGLAAGAKALVDICSKIEKTKKAHAQMGLEQIYP